MNLSQNTVHSIHFSILFLGEEKMSWKKTCLTSTQVFGEEKTELKKNESDFNSVFPAKNELNINSDFLEGKLGGSRNL